MLSVRPARRLRWLLAFVVTATCLAMAGPAALVAPASAGVVKPGSVPPGEDPFYAAPRQLPNRNGALIRSRPFTAYPSAVFVDQQLVPLPVRAFQIMYRSTNATGDPIAVTGSVLVPLLPALGARKLVAYAPGTVGPGDVCTPSYGLATGSWYESLLPAVVNTGHVVVVPDYEGMGAPGHSTYVTGWSEGRVVLDAIRAAQRLPEAGLTSRTATAVMGYSQGGSATAWAAQLQPGYAPELNIKGFAAGGVPGNLTLAARHLMEMGDIHLAVWAALGLHHAYPGLPWERLLTRRGKRLLPAAEQLCESVPLPGTSDPHDGKSLFAGLTMDDLVTTNPLSLPSWQRKLRLNSVGALAPIAPVYQYGSTGDTIVGYRAQRSAYQRWCRRGVNVAWHDTLPLDHAEAAISHFPQTLAWVNARLAGRPTTSTC